VWSFLGYEIIILLVDTSIWEEHAASFIMMTESRVFKPHGAVKWKYDKASFTWHHKTQDISFGMAT
jgi:hypothetical protein